MADFDALSTADRTRIKDFIDSGLKVIQEIEDLKGGLRDTTKALAEEFDVKPGVLTKALKHAFKSSLAEEQESVSVVESILTAAGRA